MPKWTKKPDSVRITRPQFHAYNPQSMHPLVSTSVPPFRDCNKPHYKALLPHLLHLQGFGIQVLAVKKILWRTENHLNGHCFLGGTFSSSPEARTKKPAAMLGSIFRFAGGSGVLLGMVQVRDSGMGRGNANLMWPIGRQKRIWTGLLT